MHFTALYVHTYMYIENHNIIYLCLIQKGADENGYVQTEKWCENIMTTEGSK